MLGELVPGGGGPPIPLLKPRLVLGRERSCDITVSRSNISSRHCEMEFRDGFWLVRDLNSSNGTRVNGTRCTTTWLLPDDVLMLATFSFIVRYRPPVGRMPPPHSPPTASSAAEPYLGPHVSFSPPRPPARQATPGARPALGDMIPCGGGNPIPLHKPRLVVGRHADCDIVLRDGAVSGRHCQLDWNDDCWSVRDLGSRNGIRVDGVRCQQEHLPPGSVLSIATLRYRFVYTASTAVSAAGQPRLFTQSLLEKAGLTGSRTQSLAGSHAPADDPHDPQRRRYSLDDPQ
jgi:pSer/pThr/pTyr-binding forkhead associated (FHA) protein